MAALVLYGQDNNTQLNTTQYKTKQFCGATLVASKYVVTAAHCMFKDKLHTHRLKISDFVVRLGELDFTVTGEGYSGKLLIKKKRNTL